MGTVSDMDVSIVETDKYPLIIDYLSNWAEFIEGCLGVKGRLKQCVSHWESAIATPPFEACVISEGYRLRLESLNHGLLRIIVQPNSFPAVLRKLLSSCWRLVASRSV